MLKEVSAKEALEAAIEGKPALHIHGYYGEDNEALMVENITGMLNRLWGRKNPRYLIEVHEDSERKIEEPARGKEIVTKGETVEQKRPEEKRGRKPVDYKKIIALHNAGWENQKIADEMNTGLATVKKYIRIYNANLEQGAGK